jgi:hypothetical protein
VLDKAIKGPPQRHQARHFLRPDVSDGARKATMHDLTPQRDTALLEPDVERIEVGEARHWLPQPMSGILDVLLDLTLLPS